MLDGEERNAESAGRVGDTHESETPTSRNNVAEHLRESPVATDRTPRLIAQDSWSTDANGHFARPCLELRVAG